MSKESNINSLEKAMGYLKWRVKVAIIVSVAVCIGYLIYYFIQ